MDDMKQHPTRLRQYVCVCVLPCCWPCLISSAVLSMRTYSDHTTQVMAMTWKVTEHMIFLLSLAVICSFSHCGAGGQREDIWGGQRHVYTNTEAFKQTQLTHKAVRRSVRPSFLEVSCGFSCILLLFCVSLLLLHVYMWCCVSSWSFLCYFQSILCLYRSFYIFV